MSALAIAAALLCLAGLVFTDDALFALSAVALTVGWALLLTSPD